MHNLIRCSIAIALGLASLASVCAAANFTFAAFGDTPYSEEEEPRFVNMIGEMNREKLAFAIHVGDFKSGWSPCTDALFEQRAGWFAAFHHPLIYTPGDNEWTDCRRAFGAAHDPLERLQKLRSLFFADSYSLGQTKLAVTRQNNGYPEHARWVHEGVVFVTLNVPGGANNIRMPNEFKARAKALETWLRSGFEFARVHRHRAIVLIMQANPFLRGTDALAGYAALLETMLKETVHFPGEVLLIHGDTHRYRFDQPLIDPRSRRPIGNFTRLEVYGYPFMNWVRVRVAQREGKVRFEASPGFKPQ